MSVQSASKVYYEVIASNYPDGRGKGTLGFPSSRYRGKNEEDARKWMDREKGRGAEVQLLRVEEL